MPFTHVNLLFWACLFATKIRFIYQNRIRQTEQAIRSYPSFAVCMSVAHKRASCRSLLVSHSHSARKLRGIHCFPSRKAILVVKCGMGSSRKLLKSKFNKLMKDFIKIVFRPFRAWVWSWRNVLTYCALSALGFDWDG